MTDESTVQLTVNLAFPQAGVTFVIQVEDRESDALSFSLTVTDASSNEAIPLTVDASPQLADWVRGYTRWLARARVTAGQDREGITGTFAAGLTPEQVLDGVREACDMLRQRFEPYQESILA